MKNIKTFTRPTSNGSGEAALRDVLNVNITVNVNVNATESADRQEIAAHIAQVMRSIARAAIKEQA